MRFNHILRILVLAASFLSLSVYATPPNISELKQELKVYYDHGTYFRECAQVIQEAKTYLTRRVHENQQLEHPQKLAIVLDIDETSLSNYQAIVQRDFTANPKIIHQNILKAQTPALKPTLELYKKAQHDGVSVFFVTGRSQSECQASQKNLELVGFKHSQGLFCRSARDHHRSIIPFKSSTRAQIEQAGFVIIENIGDQWSDLKGHHAERTFKLPNPLYTLP
jgi:predicted secreted acid phosphatase